MDALNAHAARPYGYAVTEHDDRLWRCLEGASKHLLMLGRLRMWSARADALSLQLGRYGLGRN